MLFGWFATPNPAGFDPHKDEVVKTIRVPSSYLCRKKKERLILHTKEEHKINNNFNRGEGRNKIMTAISTLMLFAKVIPFPSVVALSILYTGSKPKEQGNDMDKLYLRKRKQITFIIHTFNESKY